MARAIVGGGQHLTRFGFPFARAFERALRGGYLVLQRFQTRSEVTRLFGDEQVKLNCLVADFGVRDGLMRSRLFVVDTAEAVINASGTVNLANEKLDLTLKPDAKSMRILSLRSPIYVRGTFKDTEVTIDKGSMALRAGSAVALALVAPVAAIAPLVSTGSGPTPATQCQALLARGPGPGKRAGK